MVNKKADKITNKASQVFKGRVVAAKTAHTATVLLESKKTHPLYKKSYARSKKYLVQDDLGVKAGNVVEIIKCKPVSRNKHFKIIKVIGTNMEAIITEQLKEEAQAAIAEVLPAEVKEPEETIPPKETEESEKEDKKKKIVKKVKGK